MASKTLNLLSWNVNGIRSVMKKDFDSSMKKVSPDIVCLQEVRALPSDVNFAASSPFIHSSYHHVWNPAQKKGYSGTMVMSKKELGNLPTSLGIGIPDHDNEGRVLNCDLGFAYLVNVYTPNSSRELVRLPYRTSWDIQFTEHILKLQKQKPVIVCGDLNVAHKEIDLARPKQNTKNAGFTMEERQGLSNLLERTKLVDSWRHVKGDVTGVYSWWSNMGMSRQKNIGWRIDYFLVDERLTSSIDDVFIMPSIMGSDHCPVGITLKL